MLFSKGRVIAAKQGYGGTRQGSNGVGKGFSTMKQGSSGMGKGFSAMRQGSSGKGQVLKWPGGGDAKLDDNADQSLTKALSYFFL